MSDRRTRRFNRCSGSILCLSCLIAAQGCSESETVETDLNVAASVPPGVVRLDPARQENLGLRIVRVESRRVQQTMRLTGWLVVPPGSQGTVRAQVDGFVTAAHGQRLPALGDNVKAGEPLTSLHVFLTPQEIAQLVVAKEDTDIQLEQASVSMRLAEEQLRRLATAQDAVAAVRLQEVREVFERSKAAVEESQDKLPFLVEEPYDEQILVKPVPVKAPFGGKITEVHVAPDQFVLVGDALWTVADWSTLWVRVPIFEGDLSRILRQEAAQVESAELSVPVQAAPIAAPRATTPGLRTVDLYYALPNRDWYLREGQAVMVGVPTGLEEDALLIPPSALLYDGQGGTWVYARVNGDTFRRQRVEVGMRIGKDVVISRGLQNDGEVVETGTQALYGEEFKGELAAGDDD